MGGKQICYPKIVSIVMATTQSLLGLVNQLNSMEATFSTILMEAVMKLASLTGKHQTEFTEVNHFAALLTNDLGDFNILSG